MNGTTRLATLLGTWGAPVDRPAWVALAFGVLFLVLSVLPSQVHDALGLPASLPVTAELRRRLVLILGFVAAFLSLGYVAYYLRGGPRIIDATSYFLEGRMLSHGKIAWTIPSPSASFRGRFLLFREPNLLSGIFPLGYPLLLAAGFRVGAPLVIGPLIAGALVLATYALAREVLSDLGEKLRYATSLLAAVLSVVCAALRYHTADTMAHGASALGITLALTVVLRALRARDARLWALAGFLVGWVACTRPVSSLAIGVVVLVIGWRSRSPKALAAIAVGLVPGAVFLILTSRAQTGTWLTSAQAAYYAGSDGPPGCFRYGFGQRVGCLEEHKDFVAARLPHGYGLVAALLTTLRRLRVHLLDVTNLEPLSLLVLVPLRRALRGRTAPLFGVIGGQILAYAPFYFDGDYPGGGARFFADVLPLEHVLVALAVTSLLANVALVRRSLAVVGLATLGFGIHAAFEHEALANRDGGRPMYESEVGHEAGKGVVFFDTDHGFDLAHTGTTDTSHAVLAARLRGDDHDRLLIERLGRPQAHVYTLAPKGPTLAVWKAAGGTTSDLWHFEAEADWPPLSQRGGWAEPVWATGTCAAHGRALTLHADDALASASIALPVPRTGKWMVIPRVMRRGGAGHGTLTLVSHGRSVMPGDSKLVWTWNDNDSGTKPGKDSCIELPAKEVFLGADLERAGAGWELTASGGDVTLDQTILRWTK